jgi:hypothetical protein
VVTVSTADDELEAAVDYAMAPAVEDWWSGVLALERAFEPEPAPADEVLRKMRANGLIDPEHE